MHPYQKKYFTPILCPVLISFHFALFSFHIFLSLFLVGSVTITILYAHYYLNRKANLCLNLGIWTTFFHLIFFLHFVFYIKMIFFDFENKKTTQNEWLINNKLCVQLLLVIAVYCLFMGGVVFLGGVFGQQQKNYIKK